MSLDRRWLLVDPPPCRDAIMISDAGFIDEASNINGDYCPGEEINGKPSWYRF